MIWQRVSRLEKDQERRTGEKSRFICVHWQGTGDYTVLLPVDIEGAFGQAEIEELSKGYEKVVFGLDIEGIGYARGKNSLSG